ncbi:MAG: 23S rRNA (adenine(2503)-C(2))-methyltransferase RlmN [Bacteroidota bacterium]
MKKLNITPLVGLTLQEMTELAEELGEPRYRGQQLFAWVYAHRSSSIEEMKNLPRAFREKLRQVSTLEALKLRSVQKSTADGTMKLLLELRDGLLIESVVIPPNSAFHSGTARNEDEQKRLTVCVSTQVGCPVGCIFCATGSMGFYRNLSTGEIIGQIIEAERVAKRRMTNVVYMGMGEPLLNYENVLKSINIITGENSLGISARHITISTAGYPNRIKKLALEPTKVKLALSLHSANDRLRSYLMPLNKKYPVAKLQEAIQEYYHRTRRRITLEYVVFNELNDHEEDARALIAFARSVPSKINLIPFHSFDFMATATPAAQLRTPSHERMEQFAERLRAAGLTVMIRTSAGKDIAAACGQLAVQEKQSASGGQVLYQEIATMEEST